MEIFESVDDKIIFIIINLYYWEEGRRVFAYGNALTIILIFVTLKNEGEIKIKSQEGVDKACQNTGEE